jgi:hypothetical protein
MQNVRMIFKKNSRNEESWAFSSTVWSSIAVHIRVLSLRFKKPPSDIRYLKVWHEIFEGTRGMKTARY